MRVILACALLITAPTLAASHDGLVRSTPAQSARIVTLPTAATLTFGAPIGRVTSVTVRDRAGKNHVRSVRRDPRNTRRILVALGRGPRGPYLLTWRILAADGHAQRGVVRFVVR